MAKNDEGETAGGEKGREEGARDLNFGISTEILSVSWSETESPHVIGLVFWFVLSMRTREEEEAMNWVSVDDAKEKLAWEFVEEEEEEDAM